MENIIEFFNTFTILDLQSLFENVDATEFVTNGWFIFFVVAIVGLFFTPLKSYVITAVFYLLIFVAVFVGFVIMKNSEFSDMQKFIIFGGGLVSFVGYFVYNSLIKS